MPIPYTDPTDPVEVTTTSAELVPAGACQGLLWIAPVDGAIHIAFGRAATTTSRKIEQGKHLLIQGYQVPSGAVNARSASGTVQVSVAYG